jgi:hypothetical protein
MGCEVGTLRVDVIAVAVEREVAHQRRRQQADDVGQRRHVIVRAERLLGDSSAADDRSRLADHRAQPSTREVSRGNQSVVAAADNNHVIVVDHTRPFHDQYLTDS